MRGMLLACEGWELTYQSGNSNKFYRIIVTENGWTSFQWGRMHSNGQSSIQFHGTTAQARDAALRQVFAKRGKGYSVSRHLKFMASRQSVRYMQEGNPTAVAREFLDSSPFDGEKKTVLRHYDEFSELLVQALSQAEHGDLSEVLDKTEQIETIWSEIDARHAEANAALSLMKATLAARLAGSRAND